MDFFFTIDVEQDLGTENYRSLKEGIPWLLKFLRIERIKATFFVVGKTLNDNKDIIKKIKNEGHEIEVHGYSHNRFDSMSLNEKDTELKKSVISHKKILGFAPIGFRAPQHSIDIDTFMLLRKNGFKYDSSICSGNIMLLRHLFKKNRKISPILKSFFGNPKPHISNGLQEIPRPSLFMALGGFELKVYPKWLIRLIFRIHKLSGLSVNFVIHSWDLIDTPNSRTSKICSAEDFKKKLGWFIKLVKLNSNINTLGRKYAHLRAD